MVGLILSILLFIGPVQQDTVTVTTYRLTARENGPYGNVLASGFKANKKHPGAHRVVAVSRDLLGQYPFGTFIRIKGAGNFDGIWRVEDVMAKRWTKKIDLLINFNVKTNKFNNVIIDKYETVCNSYNNRFCSFPILELFAKSTNK